MKITVRFTFCILFALMILSFASCKKDETKENDIDELIPHSLSERKQRFSGNYNRDFNDLQDLHLEAAIANGITPLTSRDDTLRFKDELIRIPDALELYSTYDLTNSIPFLVPSATQLLVNIAQSFRDSLYSKDIPLHRLYVTSVLRTDDDMSTLRTRNRNASENSTHRYGTTFDISWKRFEQIDPDSANAVSPDRLKLVLAQVLFDLKNKELCYVKHERKQACFHITVR